MNRRTLKRGFLSLVPVMGLCLLMIAPAYSATYYVRPDGGTAIQCTGLTDAPYPGLGSNKDCAFSHPFWAHAPRGNNPTKMVGGDTLIIDGSNNAEYMMGFKGPNTADTSKCGQSWPYECYMNPVPSGPDPAHPTRILGKGWATGCSSPPQLWANERAEMVINLRGSDNVELQCLEITDHSDCQEHGPNPCNRTSYPYGKWGKIGLQAWDSENVLLKNVNIHGMALKGIHAGRLKDWTIEDSRIYANSLAGWDGDVGAFNSSNSGTITFTRVVLQYSGCGETYPGEQPSNCYSQSQGGYGDGLGTHQTGANWVFNNVDISHNTSDGLDLLYHDGTGTVTIKRSRFEGNAGNQVKIAANAVIENSIMIGNCNYFNGRSFTSTKSPGFDNCRAGGNTLVFAFHPGMKAEFYNSTLTGSGDVIVMSGQRSGCNGTERIISKNNIFFGTSQFGHPDITDFYYAAGSDGNGGGLCGDIQMEDDYSVIWGTKNIKTACDGKAHSLCVNPKFNEPPVQWYYGDAYDVSLQSTSPAIGRGLVLTGKSGLDYNSNERGTVWDIGALEYGSTPQVQQQQTCANGIQYCTTQQDCEGQGYYWYNNVCNAQPKPKTCADGAQYCLTQATCNSQGYYWYNDICNTQPQPKTCLDGIQYCTTQTTCEGQGYFWYNSTCNLQPKPKTCADGIQYCLSQLTCEGRNYFWYNNTCNAQPKPLTCADGIQYCTTQTSCEGQGHYWYNNTCNAQPKPKTCLDGIQYCLTQMDCANNGYYWYNNTCNAQPQPKTCADGIQYCATQTACEGQNYFWYNNTCNAQPKPKTCADDIQYCKNRNACEGQNYFWYNNTCNAQPQPAPTCADGIQYCSTKNECEGRGYYWYANSCNLEPKGQPTPQSQQEPKQDEPLSSGPTTLTSESDSSLPLPTTTESIDDNSSTTDISPETTDTKVASVDPGSSQPKSLTSSGSSESQNASTGKSGRGGRGGGGGGRGGGGGGGGKSSGGSSGSGTSLIGAGGGAGVPTNIFETSSPIKSTGMPGALPSNLIKRTPQATPSQSAKGAAPTTAPQSTKGVTPSVAPQPAKGAAPTTASQPVKTEPQTTPSQPTAVNKTDSALITPSLQLTDTTSISLNRDDIATQAEVAPEPTVESDENQPDENANLTKPESETPLDKTIVRIADLWRKMLRWFLGD